MGKEVLAWSINNKFRKVGTVRDALDQFGKIFVTFGLADNYDLEFFTGAEHAFVKTSEVEVLFLFHESKILFLLSIFPVLLVEDQIRRENLLVIALFAKVWD